MNLPLEVTGDIGENVADCAESGECAKPRKAVGQTE